MQLLKEAQQLLEILIPTYQYDLPVITVLDEATPYVINKFVHYSFLNFLCFHPFRYIEHVPLEVRQGWLNGGGRGAGNEGVPVDFAFACEKISIELETDQQLVNSDRGNEYLVQNFPLLVFCEYNSQKTIELKLKRYGNFLFFLS